MDTFPIEQATFLLTNHDTLQRLAHSPGFIEDWYPPLEEILNAFGAPPDGITCAQTVFVQKLPPDHIVVVRASSRPGGFGFHTFVLLQEKYQVFLGNPFALTEKFPADWGAHGTLPSQSWEAKPMPGPTVEEVRKVLQRIKPTPLVEDVPGEDQMQENSSEEPESPALLGGAQVLVDGGKLVFERSTPDYTLIEALWTLLPRVLRGELLPASYAFNQKLAFDVLVVPKLENRLEGFTTEEQAANYPEGKYELNLQIAAESGNQEDLNALFERRSWRETWRMAMTILIVVSIMAFLSHFLLTTPTNQPTPRQVEIQKKQAIVAAGVVTMHQPLPTLAVVPVAREEWQRLREEWKNAGQ